MNLNPIAANMTEITYGTKAILFSYKTPVAYFDYSNGAGNGVYYRTEKKWSNTTTRHLNKWIPSSANVVLKPQDWFDGLIAEMQQEAITCREDHSKEVK